MDSGHILILSGTKQGEMIPLRDGLTLGRKKAEFNLDDKRASSLHAKIESSDQGWSLVDLGSTNGIKIDGIKHRSVELKDGLEFRIGETELKVVFDNSAAKTKVMTEVSLQEKEPTEQRAQTAATAMLDPNTTQQTKNRPDDLVELDSEKSDSSVLIEKVKDESLIKNLRDEREGLNKEVTTGKVITGTISEEGSLMDLPGVPKYDENDELIEKPVTLTNLRQEEIDEFDALFSKRKQEDEEAADEELNDSPLWSDKIIRLLKTIELSQQSKMSVTHFKQVVELTFFRGQQTGTKWLLGYGPREIGVTSVDLPIIDSTAPEICFTLLPSEGGPVFKTLHKDKVLLNGSKIGEQELKPGDIIKIGNTEIEVQLQI